MKKEGTTGIQDKIYIQYTRTREKKVLKRKRKCRDVKGRNGRCKEVYVGEVQITEYGYFKNACGRKYWRMRKYWREENT